MWHAACDAGAVSPHATRKLHAASQLAAARAVLLCYYGAPTYLLAYHVSHGRPYVSYDRPMPCSSIAMVEDMSSAGTRVTKKNIVEIWVGLWTFFPKNPRTRIDATNMAVSRTFCFYVVKKSVGPGSADQYTNFFGALLGAVRRRLAVLSVEYSLAPAATARNAVAASEVQLRRI